MRRLTFLVSEDNKVRIEAHGYPGETCREATRAYLERLGGTVESDVPAGEATAVVKESLKVRS